MIRDNINNQQAVKDLAAKHLGKVGGEGYKATYDPELLVAIPRYFNRESYNIREGDLPFVGYDIWNAYEVSAITNKGLPVSGMIKLIIPADSPTHIESKSLKLYLNSFNMTNLGNTSQECRDKIEEVVSTDLSRLLNCEVGCKFFTNNTQLEARMDEGFEELDALVDLDSLEFNTYHSDAGQLKVLNNHEKSNTIKIHSDLLRSNCRVTNQPDWGDIYIEMQGKTIPDLTSIAKYIVSHRQVNHFHEEVCEMIFTHLFEAYNPEKLMISCLYTRRGGIDINPVRATHLHLIPKVFTSLNVRISKTLRQ